MNQSVITKFITAQRLSTYKDFAEYELNLKESKKHYISLSVLEVALRNAVNAHFEKFYGEGWLVNEAQFLKNDLRVRIVEAKDKLKDRKEDITKYKLVAELPFGFWTALFQSPYKHQMRTSDLKQIFPKLPKKEDLFMDRQIMSAKLNHIRKFRNRVFHHEKVVGKSEFDTIQSDIFEILGYFDEQIKNFAQRLNNE